MVGQHDRERIRPSGLPEASKRRVDERIGGAEAVGDLGVRMLAVTRMRWQEVGAQRVLQTIRLDEDANRDLPRSLEERLERGQALLDERTALADEHIWSVLVPRPLHPVQRGRSNAFGLGRPFTRR